MTKKIEDTKEEIVNATKANPYAMFNMDECIEADGFWADYGAFQVRVARMGGKNVMYNKALAAVGKKYNTASIKRLDEKKGEKLLNELYVKTIIKDWQVWDSDGECWVDGIHSVDGDGSVIKADFNSIYETFMKYPELRKDILEQSSDKNNYLKDDIVKN